MGILSSIANLVAISKTCKNYKEDSVSCKWCDRFGRITEAGKSKTRHACYDYKARHGETTQNERFHDPYGEIGRKQFISFMKGLCAVALVLGLLASIILGSIWYVHYS
jgi:hypothetical protein